LRCISAADKAAPNFLYKDNIIESPIAASQPATISKKNKKIMPAASLKIYE